MGPEVNFEVLGDYILVLAPEVDKKTKAGIIKSEQQVKQEAEKMDKFLPVVSVGDQVKNIREGEKVFIGAGSHQVLDIDGSDYILVHKAMILGKRRHV